MDLEKIKSKLCWYDPRNPNCDDNGIDYSRNGICYCDNCHNGRDLLADQILADQEKIQEIKKICRELLDALNIVIDRDSDPFGIYHNDVMDTIQKAENLLVEKTEN